MSYKVEVRPSLRRKLVSWGLPDVVLVEAYLRFQRLANEASTLLVRTREPFDGMTYHFSLVDPTNRLCMHEFAFLVQFSQDEEALIVVTGLHVRVSG